ncbi:MAG: copper-binding protein [SAR324 cluster bacterium]|nr:copper-binding protein [SAR324 cluster bacterium]
MNSYLVPRAILLTACLLLVALAGRPSCASASSEEDGQTYDLLHTIEVQLSDEQDRMRFYPAKILLQKGESYKLVLTNTSSVTHEFASETLADYIVTEKVDVFDTRGKLVAYVRGAIAEVELLPGGRIEWAFTAITAIDHIDLICDLPGHKEAGMIGSITIRDGMVAGHGQK